MAQKLIELTLPLKGTSESTGEQIIAFGMLVEDDGALKWLVVEGDGRPAVENYQDVRIDWRYVESQGWVDVDQPRGDEDGDRKS